MAYVIQFKDEGEEDFTIYGVYSSIPKVLVEIQWQIDEWQLKVDGDQDLKKHKKAIGETKIHISHTIKFTDSKMVFNITKITMND